MREEKNAADEEEGGEVLERRREPVRLLPTITPDDQFRFECCSSGDRYYLKEEPLHAGDLLEMRLEDGSWTTVRYEYNWRPISKTLEAFLFVDQEHCLRLPPAARFRWPSRR